MNNLTYYRSEHFEFIHLKNKPLVYKEHNHVSVYTIGIVIEGTITLKCDEQTITVQPDSFFIVKPYQIHALLLPENYHMLSLCIHKDLVLQYEPTPLCDILADLLAQSFPVINYTLLANAVNALYHGEPCQSFDNKILASARHIWRNPTNKIRVQEMADEIYFSKFYYIKRFKQNIGMTPHKFQLQNKIRKAQRMIENGARLTVIATDLGFYDQSHFIKCFKSIVGITPSEYRQSFKKIQHFELT